MGSRYVVTELGGWLAPSARGAQGVSVHVIDTAIARRLVATYRSEDYVTEPGRPGWVTTERAAQLARAAARARCDQLNREAAWAT
jgi:hypothetical protein